MNRTIPSKQLSLRMRSDDYETIKIAAENKNILISDEAKHRLKVADDHLTTAEMLRKLESRLKCQMFSMLCAVAGLNDEHILEAEERFIELSKKGVKRDQ